MLTQFEMASQESESALRVDERTKMKKILLRMKRKKIRQDLTHRVLLAINMKNKKFKQALSSPYMPNWNKRGLPSSSSP